MEKGSISWRIDKRASKWLTAWTVICGVACVRVIILRWLFALGRKMQRNHNHFLIRHFKKITFLFYFCYNSSFFFFCQMNEWTTFNLWRTWNSLKVKCWTYSLICNYITVLLAFCCCLCRLVLYIFLNLFNARLKYIVNHLLLLAAKQQLTADSLLNFLLQYSFSHSCTAQIVNKITCSWMSASRWLYFGSLVCYLLHCILANTLPHFYKRDF